MSFWRKHRWTRRFLIGVAFAVMVAPAQARPAPDATLGGGAAGYQLPDFSGASVDPYLTDPTPRPGEAGSGPDGTTVVSGAPTRPDDRAVRFVVPAAAPAASTDGDGSAIGWESGLTYGSAALAFALALGIAVAYLRRPRLAGL
jgi:hypothetical protein